MAAPAAPARDNSRLLTMPLEILQQIARHLTTPEYGNLRLTCRHLEASVFNAFSREFFLKKQFMITHFSLQALVDISNSRLADGLRHIVIGVERLSQRILPGNHQPDHVKRIKYREEYIDHHALLASGHDIEMMAQAFANLKNLEIVEIRDFRSVSRFRDAPDTEWKSYGTKTFEAETGVQLESPANYGSASRAEEASNHISRLFQNMLRALGRVSVYPKRLEVNLRRSGLDEKAFKFQKYDESAIFPVLAGLEHLNLDLYSGFFLPDFFVQDHDNNSGTACSTYHIRRFFFLVDKVQHLRLNFQSIRSQEARELISWLSKSPPGSSSSASFCSPQSSLSESPPPVLFKDLRQLEIGKVVVEPKVLLALLHKHKSTLRGIELHRLGLLDTSQSQGRHNQWSKFFGQMAKLGLNLNHIATSALSQERERREQVRRVLFKDSPNGRRTWQGQDLDGALKDLVNNVVVDWPDQDTESSQFDSDEDSEADDILDDMLDDIDPGQEEEDEESDMDMDDIINASLHALAQQLPLYPIIGPD
ncbi:F-box domain-containing protein [Seiridium cupressi]